MLPHPEKSSDAEEKLLWDRIFSLRDVVLARLEESRVEKLIGSSLEAKVTITASGAAFDSLDSLRDQLRYIFIVSQVELQKAEAAGELAPETFTVAVTKAEGEKCERCWNYSTRVGESELYPTVCERCVAALEEIFLYRNE